MDRRYDPRTIVTPYAFSVHPELLGRPLATPWQRLGAISLDLVVIFGLSKIGGTTLAVASGILLLWLAAKRPAKDAFGWAFRGFVGCLGITILFICGVMVAATNDDGHTVLYTFQEMRARNSVIGPENIGRSQDDDRQSMPVMHTEQLFLCFFLASHIRKMDGRFPWICLGNIQPPVSQNKG